MTDARDVADEFTATDTNPPGPPTLPDVHADACDDEARNEDAASRPVASAD